MTRNLPAELRDHIAHHPLSREHLSSLTELGGGLARRLIPEHHAAHLISVGLARHGVGGVMLTDLGRARLAVEQQRG